MTVRGRFRGVRGFDVMGWAWDDRRPAARLTVEVLADGRPIGRAVADLFRGDLQQKGIGDGAHAFRLALPEVIQDGGEHDFSFTLVGGAEPVASARLTTPARQPKVQGRVERVAGEAVRGWAMEEGRPGARAEVELLVDGQVAARGTAGTLREDLLAAGMGDGRHGFTLPLPRGTGPGARIEVRAVTATGPVSLGRLRHAPSAIPLAAARAEEVRPVVRAVSPSPGGAAKRALDAAKEAERRRDHAGAAAILDAALVEEQGHFDLLFLRSRIALGLGEAEAAERFATAALEVVPGHPRPTVILARAATMRGDHARAVALWRAIPPEDEAYRESLIKRARSLLALGSPVDALRAFDAAARRDPGDRDALRGAAETTEAVGGVASAVARWRAYAALAPEDAVVAERIRVLSARREVLAGLPSPLVNPHLRDWRGSLDGEAGEEPVEVCAGVSVRAVGPGAHASHTVAEARAGRPGDLPTYGLRVRASGGGAEVAFDLIPEAWRAGLRMGLEAAVTGIAGDALEVCLAGPWGVRRIAVLTVEKRMRLLPFDLRSEGEEGPARLLVVLSGPGEIVLLPPRAMGRLDASERPARGFEDPLLAANLAALTRVGAALT